MDEMAMEEQEVGADEVMIQLLQELVEQGRAARGEAVMSPPPAEAPPPAEGDDAGMAELEAMLAEAPPAAPPGAPPKPKPEDEDELE